MSSIRCNGSHICGGTIIDEKYILTAAHCLHYRKSDVLLPVENVEVVVGDHVTTTVQASERAYFPQRFLLHEDYNRTTLANDIALVELTEAIEYNDVIAPVCLPTGPPPVREICTTTGWGRTQGTGDPTHLNELHPNIISNEVCGSQRYWGRHITPNVVCAGYRRHGACEGDSGGPLVCNNNGASPYSLVGVTSFTAKYCRNPDGKKPSVFTNVYDYLEWIQTTTMNCTGYIRSDNGHCYKMVNDEMNYEQAKEHCQAEGSYLIEIGNQMEQFFLQGLVGNYYVWIGLQDNNRSGNWSHWNSGASLEYSNWLDGEPNNEHGREHCGELRNGAVWNGKWNDGNCKFHHKFVCERGSNQIFQEPRKCYSFHKERKNYTDAQDTCASTGGHLVEINSEWEQRLFKGIFNNVNKWDCYPNWLWLGLNHHSGDGNWRKWNIDAPMTPGESAYKLWYRWQSVNCTGMESNRRWHDSDCDTKLSFFCENSIFTKSSRNVHTFCDFDKKQRTITDVNTEVQIETAMSCSYVCNEDQHCYKYMENALSYSEAEEFCRAEGSHLVEIGSQMEQYFLHRLVGNNDVWIGLQDKTHTGNWSCWNSGSLVEYSNWHNNQPNNYEGVQYCAELGKENWEGKWNDEGCEVRQKFVCEHGGSQVFRKQRKCYSFHKEKKNYTDAQDICASEEGYLVEINSLYEQHFLEEWVGDRIWIGLSDSEEEGNWKNWNSGIPVTYSNWMANEPDNNARYSKDPEDCAEMTSGHGWNDLKCDKKWRFVCENTNRTANNRNILIFCNESG